MKPNPEWQDENGRFNGRPGPGRPRGIPNFENALRKVLSENADEFSAKFKEMLIEGDSKAWELATKRAYPEPKTEVDLNVDGPVVFGWKQPEKPRAAKKKATRKKRST